MSYHLSPITMAIIKKGKRKHVSGRVWKQGTLKTLWWERELVQPLWTTVLRFLRNLKLELSHTSAILFLDLHAKESGSQKDTGTPMFIVALFTMVKKGKQPECPTTDEWIKKMWYICTLEHYSAIKKE
ncbi:hypothetical protein mRhiFer1_009540 [Rhinolophus ferrumequinum]|uniref:Uncharacterized protein n=1 Tax=Rhinolophus ferrumequinum TaxID=59479 RepID=A0A7J7R8D1_RHIFE|nr:hypothetical protein mRhiFer1_009540 [Rhinolophus ferrumequinum]